jgi:hypothetical protein
MVATHLPLKIIATLTVLLLFGSRWISYFGFSPIFISDVLFSLAILTWLFSKERVLGTSRLRGGLHAAKFLLVVFLIWASIRGVLSVAAGYPILDILRDFVPFLYLSVAFLVSSQINRQGIEFRAKLVWWMERALGLHLVWCLIVILSGNNVSGIRVGSILESGLFSFRSDIDTTLVVVYFMLVLRKWISGHRRFATYASLIGCLVVVSFSPARASLIALMLCLAWFLSDNPKASSPSSGSKTKQSRTISVFLVGILATSILLFTSSGARLLGGLGILNTNSELAKSALGTINARELVWTQVIDWVNSSTSIFFLGAGFGINFLDVTQTLQFLEGTTYTGVRSPHNFLITVIVRVGWPAAIIFTSAIILVLLRFRKASNLDDLNFAAMTIVLAFIPISLLGVILEAPFGAIPFYFAIGVLLGTRNGQEVIDGAPERTSKLNTLRSSNVSQTNPQPPLI